MLEYTLHAIMQQYYVSLMQAQDGVQDSAKIHVGAKM